MYRKFEINNLNPSAPKDRRLLEKHNQFTNKTLNKVAEDFKNHCLEQGSVNDFVKDYFQETPFEVKSFSVSKTPNSTFNSITILTKNIISKITVTLKQTSCSLDISSLAVEEKPKYCRDLQSVFREMYARNLSENSFSSAKGNNEDAGESHAEWGKRRDVLKKPNQPEQGLYNVDISSLKIKEKSKCCGDLHSVFSDMYKSNLSEKGLPYTEIDDEKITKSHEKWRKSTQQLKQYAYNSK